MSHLNTIAPIVKLCSVHPYRVIFAIFWLTIAMICGWLLLSRPDPLLVAILMVTFLAAVNSYLAARCVTMTEKEIVVTRRPFGRLGERRWSLNLIDAFSWDANRIYSDQIQTRPLQFKVYLHLRSGLIRPVLVYYRQSEAAAAAGILNERLPAAIENGNDTR